MLAMFWRLLTPDQWSALGTVISAVAALVNLVVVIVLLFYTKAATASALAQARVAAQTLTELNLEKRLQNGRELIRAQGRLKDLGDALLVLSQAADSVSFAPDQWKAKPLDWHEMTDAVIRIWPGGIPRVGNLEQRLRAIDIDLQCLACAPVNDRFNQGRAHLKGLLGETLPLVREIWEGMMEGAVPSQNVAPYEKMTST
jgi:hypothetical protein